MFDLKVSAAGAILSATQNSSAVYGEVPSHDSSRIILNQTTLSLNGAMYVWSPAWHSDTTAVEWFNHLAKALTNSTALLDVHSPPPDFTEASNITNQIYTRILAIQMSLLAHSYSLLRQISGLFQHGGLRLSVEFSCPSPSFIFL